MLKFYYSGAPNPTKVALFLEETVRPYDPIPIDTRKGERRVLARSSVRAWHSRYQLVARQRPFLASFVQINATYFADP